MITVGVFRVGCPLELREIVGDLDSMQQIVGGLIERVAISDEIDLMCNEEGAMMLLPLNFQLGPLPLLGDVFFVRHYNGKAVSLSLADIGLINTLCQQIRRGTRKAVG